MNSSLPLDILDEISSHLSTDMLLVFIALGRPIRPFAERHLYKSLRIDAMQAVDIMDTSARHLVHTTALHISFANYEIAGRAVEFLDCLARHGQLTNLAVASDSGALMNASVPPALQILISSSPLLRRLDIYLDHQDHSPAYATFLRDALGHSSLRLLVIPIVPSMLELLRDLHIVPRPVEFEATLNNRAGLGRSRQVWFETLKCLSLSQLQAFTLRSPNSYPNPLFYTAAKFNPMITRLNLGITYSQEYLMLPTHLSVFTHLIHFSINNQSAEDLRSLPLYIAKGLARLPNDSLESFELFISSGWKSVSDSPHWSNFFDVVKTRHKLQLVKIYFGGDTAMSEEKRHMLATSMASETLSVNNIYMIENADLTQMW
ncbi:hypothetical protein DL96DRAFT_1810916, partial [Flagelloscypha sp. PMI_526]